MRKAIPALVLAAAAVAVVLLLARCGPSPPRDVPAPTVTDSATTESVPSPAPRGWPICPTDEERPIGSSFGELQLVDGVYQHNGIDILVPTTTWVCATAPGTITELVDNVSAYKNRTIISGSDGVEYGYYHLATGSADPSYRNHYTTGTPITAGQKIAKVGQWHREDYHHLHYQLKKGSEYLNPMRYISPNPDPDPPEITAVRFAQDDGAAARWERFEWDEQRGCTVVSGTTDTDIIVQISDRDDARITHPGAATLWVYDIHWRACSNSNPDCEWHRTHTFDSMPVAWGEDQSGADSSPALAQFSKQSPWVSRPIGSSQYLTYTLYAIVTNFVNHEPSTAGAWNTKGLSGIYTVSISATDYARNPAITHTTVCVDNAPD